MTIAEFTVSGRPETKGSAKAFRHRGTGKIIVRNDNEKCAGWSRAVGWSARAAMRGAQPISGPVTVEAVFRFPRPKTTKLRAPRLDLDKLARALLDGMTGIVYVDDKQVAELRARKEWGPAGVAVSVFETPGQLEPLAALGANKEVG